MKLFARYNFGWIHPPTCESMSHSKICSLVEYPSSPNRIIGHVVCTVSATVKYDGLYEASLHELRYQFMFDMFEKRFQNECMIP